MQCAAHAEGALLHPKDSKSCGLLQKFESASVVFHGKLHTIVRVTQRDLQDGRIPVAQGIGNRFPADVQQSIGKPQIKRDRATTQFRSCLYLVPGSLTCRFSQFSQQVVLYRWRNRPEHSKSSAGFLMATANQLIGNAELVGNRARVNVVATHYASPDALDLVPDSGKALRHGVVNFMSQPFSLAVNLICFPVFETKVGKLDQQGKS